MTRESILTTLAAAFFISILVTIYLPIQLYAGNEKFLNFTGADHLALFIASATGLFLFLSLIYLLVLGTGLRIWYSRLLLILALFMWMSAFVFTQDHGQLDGNHLDLSFTAVNILTELVLFTCITLIVVWAARRGRLGMLSGFMLTIAFMNVFVSGFTIWSTDRSRDISNHTRATIGEYANFSSSKNITVLILDGLQSDVFEEIIEQDQDLKRSFSDFIYYPDTMGIADSTVWSIPAIHSGHAWAGEREFESYFENAIANESIISVASDSGFASRELNPYAGICARGLEMCARAIDMIETGLLVTRHESLLLMDMALLRTAPSWLKAYIYSDGNWLLLNEFGWLYQLTHMAKDVFNSYTTMQDLANLARFDSDVPVFTFMRMLTTHSPFVMNGNCLFQERDQNREAVLDQSRCIVNATANLVDRHRASASWDSSVFVITADHGLHPGRSGVPPLDTAGFVSTRARGSDILEPGAQARAANANPLLAIHYPGIEHTLQESRYPAQLTDIAATICQFLDDCSWPYGINLYDQSAEKSENLRVRYYMDWIAETDVEHYRVIGPLWEANSWQKINPD
jgi:hypothetical protein